MTAIPQILDGWVDAIPAPGLRDTATFDLIVPITLDAVDEDIHDTVVTCTSGDPRIVHELLNRIQPGDLLRATGTLVRLPTPGEPALLVVDALEVLDRAPIPVLREMAIERYGPYVCWFDADTTDVEVFTEGGTWVGTAPEPNGIGELLEAFEQRQAAGGE
ncbi:hypothetical protein AB0A60_32750 [Streptomyces sp. NPDC046275]|uniref:hypothetical protein n=1 Tax=Streptomyces sp. NPDC046275 TaxID=3157201 RepID=UPI0033CEAEFA